MTPNELTAKMRFELQASCVTVLNNYVATNRTILSESTENPVQVYSIELIARKAF